MHCNFFDQIVIPHKPYVIMQIWDFWATFVPQVFNYYEKLGNFFFGKIERLCQEGKQWKQFMLITHLFRSLIWTKHLNWKWPTTPKESSILISKFMFLLLQLCQRFKIQKLKFLHLSTTNITNQIYKTSH